MRAGVIGKAHVQQDCPLTTYESTWTKSEKGRKNTSQTSSEFRCALCEHIHHAAECRPTVTAACADKPLQGQQQAVTHRGPAAASSSISVMRFASALPGRRAQPGAAQFHALCQLLVIDRSDSSSISALLPSRRRRTVKMRMLFGKAGMRSPGTGPAPQRETPIAFCLAAATALPCAACRVRPRLQLGRECVSIDLSKGQTGNASWYRASASRPPT